MPSPYRCACEPLAGAIDVHAHFVPDHFPPSLSRPDADLWPSISARTCDHGVLSYGAGPGKSLPAVCWDTDRRQAQMDAESVSVQVLSPMPDLFGYGLSARSGLDLCRFVNDEIAALTVRHPGRFYGLGMLPMQSPDDAAGELERCVQTLGLQGVELGTNVNGVPIGDASFHPVFAQAQQAGAAVYVHPVRPVGMEMIVGPKELQPVIGFSTDSTLALASLITSGVPDAFPDLRIGATHCGGGFGLLLPRLQHAWLNAPAVRDFIQTSPLQTARRFYYDTLTLNVAALRYAMGLFGTERMMLGTDFPFPMGDRQGIATLRQACDDAQVLQRILRDNACDFLFGER